MMMEMFYLCANAIATSHSWLLKNGSIVREAKEFKFYFNSY